MEAKDQSRAILSLKLRLQIVVASQSKRCTSIMIDKDRWELFEYARQIFG